MFTIPNTGTVTLGDFKKLKVWRLAHHTACEVYRATKCFPKVETYGLAAQLRRCASSIPANLAEGSGRLGDPEFSRFVRISLGSATELEYHLILCRDVGLLSDASYRNLVSQVLELQRMLAGFHRKLKLPLDRAVAEKSLNVVDQSH